MIGQSNRAIDRALALEPPDRARRLIRSPEEEVFGPDPWAEGAILIDFGSDED